MVRGLELLYSWVSWEKSSGDDQTFLHKRASNTSKLQQDSKQRCRRILHVDPSLWPERKWGGKFERNSWLTFTSGGSSWLEVAGATSPSSPSKPDTIPSHGADEDDAILHKFTKLSDPPLKGSEVREWIGRRIGDLMINWSWKGLYLQLQIQWLCPSRVVNGVFKERISQIFIFRSSPQVTIVIGLFGLKSTSLAARLWLIVSFPRHLPDRAMMKIGYWQGDVMLSWINQMKVWFRNDCADTWIMWIPGNTSYSNFNKARMREEEKPPR